MFAGTALSVCLLVYAGLSLFIISGPYLYVVVCVLYAYNLTVSYNQLVTNFYYGLVIVPPTNKVCEGYVFTRVCLSMEGGGVVSQHALQVASQHALQVSRPTPKGELQGSGPGSPGPHPGGVEGLGGLEVYTWRGAPGPHLGGCIPSHTEADLPPPDGYCCGWYTSYWNAFLFLLKFIGRSVYNLIFTGRNEVVAKVIFLHLSVILLRGGRGRVCLSACWDTATIPPGSDTTPPGPGRPPPGPDRHPPDEADTPLDQTPPWDQADPPDQADTPPAQADTPTGSRLQHTVYERPVRILLECILVNFI